MMNNDKKDQLVNDDPATVPGPAAFEEELRDYSKTNDENLIDNMPDSHPEPSPTQNPQS
jgi:hypothetical protein